MSRWLLLAALAVMSPGMQAAEEGAPAPAPAAAKPIPIEDFSRNPDFTKMAISPGGQYLAVRMPVDDTVIVVVIDRTSNERTATIRARGENVIDEFWWVNETRLVASVAEQWGGVDHPQPNGELYAINADGSDSMQLFGYRGAQQTGSRARRGGEARYASAFVIDTIPDDRRHILVQTFDWRNSQKAPPAVEMLDVYTGKTRRVGVGPKAQAGFIADHNGKVRVATASTDALDTVMYLREGEDGEWRVFNDPARSGTTIVPLMFTRDNQSVYATVSRPGKPSALHRIKLADGAKTLLYEGGADPGELLLTPDRKDAYGVVTHDGRTAFKVFDPESPDARLALAVQQAFPGQVALLGSFALDGKHALVHVSSDRNPGDYYLFDTEKKNAEYIGSARKWIDPERMAEMRPVSLKARDGLELNGYLTLPPGSDGRKLPLVVNPHGGPYGVRDFWGFNPEVQLLASRGYAVLQLNFRGSGGYGDDFIRAGYRQWGQAMQDDLTDATNWAVKQGHADPARLCIYGASYGGYASLSGVVREPDLYRCAIGYVGVYDLELMYRDGDIPRSLYGKTYLQTVLGTDSNELRQRSPAANVDRIKADLMIVVGGRDVRVPPSQGKALRSALDKRDYHYEWMLKDSEGHGFYRPENRVELYTKMLEFLGRNSGDR